MLIVHTTVSACVTLVYINSPAVGREGPFGINSLRKGQTGPVVEGHVGYKRARVSNKQSLNSCITASSLTFTPTASAFNKISWKLVDGRKIIREIVLKEVPQWEKGPRDEQIECWSYALTGLPTMLIASTGWGKTSAFFVPILILRNLAQYPRRGISKPPAHPVALMVTQSIAVEEL